MPKPDVLTNFKLRLKNPYRFYENVEMLDYEYVDDDLKVSTVNAIVDRVSSLFLWLKASGRIKFLDHFSSSNGCLSLTRGAAAPFS